MKKSDAISLFGSGTQLAKALGLTKGRISQLPEDLDQVTADRVVGAAVRLEKIPDVDWAVLSCPISRLHEDLDQVTADRVVGAAVRLAKIHVCTDDQPIPFSSEPKR